MKKNPFFLAILAILLCAGFYFRNEITDWYKVEIAETGTMEQRVPVPKELLESIRLDRWEIRKDNNSNTYIICYIHNGIANWNLSSIEANVTTGDQSRTFRLNFHRMNEHYDKSVYFGARDFLASKSSAVAQCLAHDFVNSSSTLGLGQAYGWQN